MTHPHQAALQTSMTWLFRFHTKMLSSKGLKLLGMLITGTLDFWSDLHCACQPKAARELELGDTFWLLQATP